MSEMIEFYAIRKKDLGKLPVAVKKFVDDFFVDKVVFGEECLVALSCGSKSPWHCMEDGEYEEGLSEEEINNCGVFDWISNHPDVYFEYKWS